VEHIVAISRQVFSSDHEEFRNTVKRFLEAEVLPHQTRWEERQYVDREVWEKAGAAGLLCSSMPEEFGGVGVDRGFSMVVMEELARTNASGIGWGLHSEIVAPYILHYGSDDLKKAYLPEMAIGKKIGAIAMTEPAAGSDLQGIKTTAVKDGDSYVLNGSKTFITNGYLSDFVIVVAKTDPQKAGKGISLFVVDSNLPGFTKGKPLHKVGQKSQDTCELFFDQVRVPASHLLGEENKGFIYLMQELPWERLQIAIAAIATSEAAIEHTLNYVRDRKVFGKSLSEFQNTRYKLAEMKTEVQIGRVFVDRCIEQILDGSLDASTASMAKYWTTDLQCKVLDECVQLHGGYGYMWEYYVGRAWADARVARIYGGTNEIMKELISRNL
jgi:alkylation response protein AidB-like acyl-CoA dehydrogenase